MNGLTAIASNVGAGVSQVRFQDHVWQAQLKDQERSAKDVRSVALQLIQSALSISETTGRDLDVMA
jgi:hypothetical protein